MMARLIFLSCHHYASLLLFLGPIHLQCDAFFGSHSAHTHPFAQRTFAFGNGVTHKSSSLCEIDSYLHLSRIKVLPRKNPLKSAVRLAAVSTSTSSTSEENRSDRQSLKAQMKTKNDASNDRRSKKSKRRAAPNKRISLKWVVESVEKCLCEEKGYQSPYRDEDDNVSAEWDNNDVILVDNLWSLCWGECDIRMEVQFLLLYILYIYI